MKIELIVVSGRTLDTNPSFMILIDGVSYLFNVPDGTQRLFMQNRWKLFHVKQLFFTSYYPESIGGILGAIMTMSTTALPTFGITSDSRVKRSIAESFTYVSTPELLPVFTADYSDPKFTVTSIPLTQSTAFRVQFADYPGKFLPQSAKNLGIPAGPLYKKLAIGESVTLADGRIVHSKDVMTPSTPGDILFVIDCRDISDLKLLANVDLKSVTFFVHFTEASILCSPEYIAFFTDTRKHLCFLPSGRFSYGAVADLYSRITGASLCSEPDGSPPGHFVDGYSGLTYQFLPAAKQEFVNSLKIQPSPHCDADLPTFSTFAVTILGTGAALPGRMRNITGILVHIKSGFVVLDPGEDFVGQVMRRYGRRNIENILANIQFIWISHTHGDHYFGLYQLLYERAKVTERVIQVCMNEPLIAEFQMRETMLGNNFFRVEFVKLEAIILTGSGFSIKSVPVIHTDGSHGCLLTIDDTWKLAFSGDRCIDDGFVEAVGSCDLLIHEATYENSMTERARTVGHSTVGQAIQTGVQLSAKWIVLTHFSSRYTDFDLRVENQNVIFAFDYLSFVFEDEAMEIARDLGNRFFTLIDAASSEDVAE
jgi:ribonuclease Z